jgi:hypothetical protein
MEPTQATGILGLLQEIERQLGALANRFTQTFHVPPNKTIVELCHQDDDYYRMLTQLKSRLIGSPSVSISLNTNGHTTDCLITF